MNDNQRPLVSVVIVSYNSSYYILETLNSIASQTYKNLELIISDDCSTDNTIILAAEWIKLNSSRFVKAVLVKTETNRGVSANINNGLSHCRGKWIKILAADDLLVENAICEYVNFCESNNCHICASDFICINENSLDFNPRLTAQYYHYMDYLKLDLNGQRRVLYKGVMYPGPTAFQSKESLEKVGGCSDKYISEEWPLQYLSNKAGYRVYPVQLKLVKYRIHSNSFCRASKNPRYRLLLRDQFLFYRKEVICDVLKDRLFLRAWHDYLRYLSYYLCYYHRCFKVIMILSPIKICELVKRIW